MMVVFWRERSSGHALNSGRAIFHSMGCSQPMPIAG